MITKNVVMICLLLVCAFNAKAYQMLENEKGNGGDAVICENGFGNDYEGTYQLDYFFAMALKGRESLIERDNVEDYLDKINAKLRKTIPKLSSDLRDFRKFIDNEDDYTLDAIWVPMFLKLSPINDENLQFMLPNNCNNIVQAVRRSSPAEGFVKYEYHTPIFEKFEEDPIQLSFMYVHEWLRKYTVNAEVIRNINMYIHSKSFYTHDEKKIMLTLKRMGLDTSKYAVYTAWKQVHREVALYKAGDQITKEAQEIGGKLEQLIFKAFDELEARRIKFKVVDELLLKIDRLYKQLKQKDQKLHAIFQKYVDELNAEERGPYHVGSSYRHFVQDNYEVGKMSVYNFTQPLTLWRYRGDKEQGIINLRKLYESKK